MKYLEITEQTLNEINMSPGSLAQAAKKINALAGMEFEMIVPGARQAEEYNPEYEADYDRDQRTRSLRDVEEFFHDGDYNGRRDIDALRNEITEAFFEWRSEKLQDFWNDNQETIIREWLSENVTDDNGDPLQGDALNKRVEAALEITISGKNVEETDDRRDAEFDFYEDPEKYDADDYSVDDYLNEEVPYMTDVASNFDIQWPYYYDANEGSGEGEISVDDIADEFSSMIGKPVNASNNYHGARREAGHYVVEPDGSLSGDDDEDGGLEFVSPPLPLNELLDDLQKVKKWADSKNIYTNDSTGLHINVSIPDRDFGDLDYVKLAILLGDEYVLKEFGRTSNHFCQSALKIVKKNIQQRPDDVGALLEKMKEHLSTAAARAIHSGSTSKYTSINTKTGYIEFRSPGGDWLNNTFDKIVPTLMRFVVAMDAAMDETAYKEEYAKKLYKLLAPSEDGTDTLKFFTQYSAGELPRSALASFVRQAQLKRKINKGTTDGKKYWWNVGRPGYGASVEVVATSKEEAIALGKKEYPEWDYSTDMTATPLRPYEEKPADDNQDTQRPADVNLDTQRPAGGGNFTGWWLINDPDGRELHRFNGIGNRQGDANRVAMQWMRDHPEQIRTGTEVVPEMR
jgi:hypothetical protein